MIRRVDLLKKLSIVQPALSSTNLIPVLTHFWFTGKEVLAYNDQIAISVPLVTPFTGAVPGNTLLSLLKNSKAKTIEFEPNGDVMLVKAASSRLKLGLLPEEQFLFEMPKTVHKEKQPIQSLPNFFLAIESCMRSVGVDASIPDQLGITLEREDDQLNLYSTNNATLSHSTVKLNNAQSFKGRVILSTAFCEQLLKLAKGSPKATVDINNEYAMVTTATGIKLFGRLIESERPVDFKAAIEHHFPKTSLSKLVPIPTKLRLILERAIIMSDKTSDEGYTTISVDAGKVRFLTRSASGQVNDIMQVADAHPDVKLRVEAKFLKNGYGFFEKMLMTDSCIIMAKGAHRYFIATVGR